MRTPRRPAALLATSAVCACCLFLPCRPLSAVDLFVNHETGDDRFDGRSATAEAGERGPFRTILRAVKAAGPGDTVHLAATAQPYRESVLLYTHPTWYHPGGEPDRPLTIDGHGATVTGAEPCPPAGWKPWRDRVYCRDDFPDTGGLLVDGARVGGVSATAALAPGDWLYFPPFKHLYWRPLATPLGKVRLVRADAEPEVVEPGRWGQAGQPGVVRLVGVAEPTELEVAGARRGPITLKERLKPGEWTREGTTLYYHLPEGKVFADLTIQCVVRGNGVQISGSTAHVVVKNLHAQYFWNDGFNIHGGAHHLRFENIVATGCFDEGYSAHSDVESEIDGALLLFNASGLTNVMRARTRARNLLIAFNDGIGYAGMEQSEETVENLILIDNGSQLGGGRVTARNVLAIATGGRRGSFQFGGPATLERLTVFGPHNLRLDAKTELTVRDAVVAGAGDWHIRADDPAKRLATVERLVLDPALTLSHGTRHPWTAMPLMRWLDEYHPGRAAPLTARPRLEAAGVLSGLPEGIGCAPELLARAAAFLREHAQRWQPPPAE